jgi:virginiamycin A acetyltransferase
MLLIAPSATVSRLADIEDSTRGSRIEVAAHAVIDAFVKIKPAGGTGDVFIGEGSYINSGTVIYSGNGVSIGKGVLVAANCTFAAANHEYRARAETIRAQGFMPSRGGIVVADDVWIGAGVVILDGSRIGQGCVIGALSLIRGELAPFTIYGGNPLRVLGERR